MSHLVPSRLPRPRLWLVLGLLASVAAAQAMGVSAQTPETPRPTSSPTSSPADLSLADGFADLGKFGEAVGAYEAVIQHGTLSERLIARLSLAKLLLDNGENAEAIRHLDAYLIEAPETEDVSSAQLLMADALKADAQYSDAISLYDTYLLEDGPVAAYAQMGRAESLAWSGDPQASAVGESVLENNLPKQTRVAFITTMAQALESTRPQEALVWYQQLGDESDLRADDALAIWRSAMIEREAGNDGRWFTAWPTIMERYSDTPTAAEAVTDVPPYKTLAPIVDPYYTGLAHYEAGDSRLARADFLMSLSVNRGAENPALAARSSFYLAVLDERANTLRSAIARYGDVLELDASVDLADDALWWQARVYEQLRQPTQASEAYERILSDYDGSGYASEARFRLALLQYDAGNMEQAAAAFAQIADSSSREEEQRALLWQGKVLDEAGDDDAAEEIWQSLAAEAPSDYYGLRAAVLLGDANGTLRDAGIDDADEPDWSAIETWLRDTGAGHPAAAQQSFDANEHWDVGRALLTLGMEHRASAEFNEVLQGSLGDPNMQLLLARRFNDIGQHSLSARAMSRLIANMPEEALTDAPEDIWRLAYPAAYATAFDEAANASDVPNLLLLSLVRQESFFDPLAGSSAGALGLTQVVGPTGAEIASDLELADFETDDLYHPSVSLQFGAHYLRTQLDFFDDNFYYTLAAYNGGPGNAQRWARAAGDDVDRFVAEIEFSQTEAYVKLVSENLARYRQVYQGLDEPALPRD